MLISLTYFVEGIKMTSEKLTCDDMCFLKKKKGKKLDDEIHDNECKC
jgi:hypothetical protein